MFFLKDTIFASVDYTVVEGRMVVREGHLTTVDEIAVSEEANRVCRDYLSRP